jgi:MarR family transcriptional regulator, organic hydroperoxide resistance regulator
MHAYRIELADMGVTPTQAGVLLYVHRYPGTYQKRVADSFGMAATSMGMTMRKLQGKGWVKRQRAPHDDKYVLVTVTRKGVSLVRKIARRLAMAPGWQHDRKLIGSPTERCSACA